MKLTSRLLIAFVFIITLIAFTSSSSSITPTVAAGGSDCEVAGQVCRQMSQGIYNLCIELGGAADQCALQEAQNTISCMAAAGCPLHN